MNPRTRILVALAALAVLVAAFFALRTFSPPAKSGLGEARDTVLTAFPPATPAKADLTTPDKAVESYLRWVTFSYRMMNSDLSSATMEPTETVRVDSYVQLMRQSNKGIDQTLTSFKVTFREVNGNRASIRANETWRYAYFSSSDPMKAVSPLYSAEYVTIYRLVRGKDGLWRVDQVEATPKGAVK